MYNYIYLFGDVSRLNILNTKRERKERERERERERIKGEHRRFSVGSKVDSKSLQLLGKKEKKERKLQPTLTQDWARQRQRFPSRSRENVFFGLVCVSECFKQKYVTNQNFNLLLAHKSRLNRSTCLASLLCPFFYAPPFHLIIYIYIFILYILND